ncbi:MAG TPA: CoA transferase [Alteraurantiacibacter sp.]
MTKPRRRATSRAMLDLLGQPRVLDFTTVVLGPYASQILGDLGADVIKIEPLAGDIFRAAGPGHSAEMGAGYLNLNRNKRSLAIDMRVPEARAAIDRLVEGADLVIHNMRPASAERLGIGFERLKTINPRIAYVFAAGFGSEGRDADEPAYDDVIQARSGLAAINANAEGEPRFLKTIAADKVAGLHLAIAALGALAKRDRTGEAICVEAPMFESVVSFLFTEQLAGRTFEPPLGSTGYHRLMSPNRRPHATKDGFLAVMPYSTQHWQRFFELAGKPEMASDARVTDAATRSRNVDALYAMIGEAMPARTTAEWLAALGERDIPCAPVQSLDEVLEDPHLADVGMFPALTHPSEGAVHSVRSPFRAEVAGSDAHAPRLGEHSREVLLEAGLSEAEVDALVAKGVVGQAG